LFARIYRLRTLEDDPEALLAYALFTYRGPDVLLACGETVRRGNRVMELHFRRAALAPLIAEGDVTRAGIGLLRLGERDIPRLAHLLQDDPALQEVRAIHALTLFHRGVTRFGFEVTPVAGAWEERWFTAWHRLLMARDAAGGARRVREHRRKLVTRHIWQSRAALIRRYCSSASPGLPDSPNGADGSEGYPGGV
jgi:hypothetical protein